MLKREHSLMMMFCIEGGIVRKKDVPKLGILTLLSTNFTVVDVFMTIANQKTTLLTMKCDKIRSFCIFFDLLIWRNLRPVCTQSKMSLQLPNVIVHRKSFSNGFWRIPIYSRRSGPSTKCLFVCFYFVGAVSLITAHFVSHPVEFTKIKNLSHIFE